MARSKISGIFDPRKIIIDGFPLEYKEVEVSREQYPFYISELEFNNYHSSQMKLTIRGYDETEITCVPDFYEVTEDAIYIYGVLRKLFPTIFIDRELLIWQEDYLRDQGKYKFRMRYFRDDPFFDTPEAKLFHSGFQHGKKYSESQRKSK